jgi:hypothetical protein
MRNKYRNKKIEVDGHKFDSKKEATRYICLKNELGLGIIGNLKLQPEFILQDGFKISGKKFREIKYVADFMYTRNGKTIVEDVKGIKTEVYKIKKKMFLKRYNHPDLIFIET